MSPCSRTNFVWHPMPRSGIIFFMNALLLLWSVTLAKTLEPILWSKDSANFTSSGINITVEINDLINIECPKTENTTEGRLKAQYLKFTQVSSQGYDQCALIGRRRHLLSCNRPFQENILTLLFQQHTPYPGGATFTHGRDYYFITTSNGSETGIDNTSGGLCSSHNMKLRVYVKPKPTAAPTTINPNASTTVTPSTTSPQGRAETTRETTTTKTTVYSTSATPSFSSTTTKTTVKSTEKAMTTETNKIANPIGEGARLRVSRTLLCVAFFTWLAAVVRWHHP